MPLASHSGSDTCSSVRQRSGKGGLEGLRGGMALTVKPEVYSRVGAAMKDVRHYMENHRQHLVYSFIFFFLNGLLFSERFYSKWSFFLY